MSAEDMQVKAKVAQADSRQEPAQLAGSSKPGMALAGPQHSALAEHSLALNAASSRAVAPFKGPLQRAQNRTGLPDALKAGVESLSGIAMDHVRVHYNSAKPAQLSALAYAQGNDIHLGPGQERHLPHEAWHIVQQLQGRVRPTMQMAGVDLNDEASLEREADLMGSKAASGIAQGRVVPGSQFGADAPMSRSVNPRLAIMQRESVDADINSADATMNTAVSYQGQVKDGINDYTGKIRTLAYDTDDSRLLYIASRMASGYKTWAANYYNKSQAYLYEAQKASQHTIVEGAQAGFSFASLGENADLEPDLTVIQQPFKKNAHKERVLGEELREAVEFKASTSELYESVDKLVANGFKQLKKRQLSGDFHRLRLEVHNDNPANHWPITDSDFSNTFHGMFSAIKPADYWTRLQQRTELLANTDKISLPVEVSAERGSHMYAFASLNQTFAKGIG